LSTNDEIANIYSAKKEKDTSVKKVGGPVQVKRAKEKKDRTGKEKRRAVIGGKADRETAIG